MADKFKTNKNKIREALLGGFANSKILEIHGKRMLTNDYKPGFKTKLHAKDMRIVKKITKRKNINLAGTNITEVFALVSVTASLTVLKTGKLKCSWPPFPGVTPPTILVPYAMHCSACIVACEPVKP